MSVFQELQRRNVIRVATAYVVVAWLIIQVAETLFPVFGFSGNAMRVVVIALGIGFVPAVVGAWIFQFTRDGLQLDEGIDRDQAVSRNVRRNLDRAIIVVLVLGISYFAFDKFVLAPDRAAIREAEVAEQARADAVVGFYGDRSIAVLPFDNMTSDPEQEYFVDGIAEEVLNLLARIRELRVISRTSAFAFKGQGLEATDIAERLDVAHVLEGSVRKFGNTIRVTAQLIDARTDRHLWSRTYEREFENAFAIQDEIAADVAENLRIELLQPLPRSRYVDPEVFALTAQAKQLSEIRPDDVGRKMHGLLSRALDIDPDYVPALEWLISSDYFREQEGLITNEEMYEQYDWIKSRIRELEPNNGLVDAMDAWQLAHGEEYEQAAAMYLRSLSKGMSNSNTVRLSGVFARQIGKMDTSVKLLEHAVAIDPLCFQCLYQLSRAYLYSGDYERAQQARERYMAIGSAGNYHYGAMLLLQGKAQTALDYFRSLDSDSAQVHAGMAMAWHSLGNPEQAEDELAKVLISEDADRPDVVADVMTWMGRNDLAFELLQEQTGEGLDGAAFVFNPLSLGLRDDPRWEKFRESVGKSAARLDAIEFNPDLPD